jgi:hypothetical protein
VIFSRRHWNTQISSGCGTCIVLNRDGWLLTAAHIAVEILQQNKHRPEIDDYVRQRDAIINDPRMHPNDKRKRLRVLKENPLWITNQAALWGVGQNTQIRDVNVNSLNDLAFGRLEPFNPDWVSAYPVFKNPQEPMLAGTSLCRLGFPFHEIQATFNEQTQTFELGKGVLPVPRFPNEGIHTRIVTAMSEDGKNQAKLLETSSPGLRGQSGGPIFDCNGHVWAMQSRTQSLSLGIAPEVIQGKQKVIEHQFMHVGWGTHVEEIIAGCKQLGIQVSLSS